MDLMEVLIIFIDPNPISLPLLELTASVAVVHRAQPVCEFLCCPEAAGRCCVFPVTHHRKFTLSPGALEICAFAFPRVTESLGLLLQLEH